LSIREGFHCCAEAVSGVHRLSVHRPRPRDFAVSRSPRDFFQVEISNSVWYISFGTMENLKSEGCFDVDQIDR